MDGSSAEPSGRRWLLIALAIATLVILFVGSDSPEASAQATTGTPTGPTATPTPPFAWIIPAESDKSARSRLYVDPLVGRFRFDYTDEKGTPVPGTAVPLRGIRATDKVISFKWEDRNRPCETATPAPPGRGPIATATPGRCPMYVWATLDRQRRQVRATLFRRTASGKTVSNVVAKSTPLPLPTADDPFVMIQDFQMVPKTRIVQPTEQLSFKNNMSLRCRVLFDSVRTAGKPPADTKDFDLGYIGPGQISRKFPATPVAVETPGANPTPPPEIWRAGEFTYTVRCDGTSTEIKGQIVIPG